MTPRPSTKRGQLWLNRVSTELGEDQKDKKELKEKKDTTSSKMDDEKKKDEKKDEKKDMGGK